MAESKTSQVRKRTAAAATTYEAEGDETEESSLVFNMEKADSLAAYELAVRPGARTGYMHKKAARCCKGLLDCCPIWNKRYFIIYGDYLYRYASSKSKKPKGMPLMLAVASVRKLDVVDKNEGFFIEVGDYRKELILRCKTSQEREEWVSAFRSARMRIIREDKGHAPVDRHTAAANKAGSDMYESQIRREKRELALQMKELNTTMGLPAPQ